MTPSAHHPRLPRQMQLVPYARPESQQSSGTMQIQCQRPQNVEHPSVNEERRIESVSRNKDLAQPKSSPKSTPRASPSTKEVEVDAEAIMAAVAMTELFNCGNRESATPTTELTASFAQTEIDKIKRKPLEQENDETNKKPKFSLSPRSPDDDDIRTAVSASRSFTSVESRNPPSPGIKLPPRSSPPYQATVPARYPPPQHWISGPPPPHQFHMMDPRFALHEPPHGYRLIPVKMAYRVSPPHPFYSPSPPPVGAGAAAGADNFHQQQQQQQQQSSLEDRRVGSLPKALSFRKICSHCGKTRGEHGFGFGHKCQYRDCGKCGAAQHWHEAAGQRMGVECQLSVGQGAVPGAVAAYDRKLQELAARADLQRDMRQQQHQDQQQQIQAASQDPAASSVVAKTTVAVVQ